MSINEVKVQQLGMPIGTAMARLKKMMMFQMAQKLGQDICYRCGKRIETVKEISVEHKKTWLHSEDPIKLFFDLDNIAFSHHSCNSHAGRVKRKRVNKIPESGYRGVFRGDSTHKNKPWYASLRVNGKHKNLGYFKTSREAAEYYDEAFLKNGGISELTNQGLGLL